MINRSFIAEIPRFEYIVSSLRENVFSLREEPYFWDQINTHLSDIKTFSQADLCESGVIKEKVYVMTVHKAKGLEFEHVILYNAVDGTYPFFLCKTAEEKKEDARVFYVGLLRAKKRISVLYSKDFRGYQKHLTPYLDCIKERFTIYKRGQQKKGRDAVRIPAKIYRGRFCNQFESLLFRTSGGVVSFRQRSRRVRCRLSRLRRPEMLYTLRISFVSQAGYELLGYCETS